MNYLDWNAHLFKHFFNTSKHGQTVLLNIDIHDLFKTYVDGCGLELESSEVAIASFVSALGAGPAIYHYKSKAENKYPSICSKIYDVVKYFYQEKNRGNYRVHVRNSEPPLFAYAVGLVYSLEISKDRGLYVAVRRLFGKLCKPVGSDGEIRDCISEIWNSIEFFLNQEQGELGYFFNRKDSPPTRKYVDKIYSQFILPRTELIRMPTVFWELELSKEDAYRTDLLEVFLSRENELRKWVPNTLCLLKTKDGDAELVVEVLNRLLASFDGWSPVTQVENVSVERNLARLRLALSRNSYTGNFDFSYYFQAVGFTNGSFKLGEQDVLLNEENWSSKLTRTDSRRFDFPFSLQDKIHGLKVFFKPELINIYILGSGMSKGLSSKISLQLGCIERAGLQYLLLHMKVFEDLSEWIGRNEGIEECFPMEEWKLFRFDGFVFEGPYDSLRFSSTKRASFKGGLKAKGRHTYVFGFPLSVRLEGAKGDEILCIDSYEQIPFNNELSGFALDFIDSCGEYHIEIFSPSDGVIELGAFGKFSFVDLNECHGSNLISLKPDELNYYQQKKEFIGYQQLVRNGLAQKAYPPQLLAWTSQETFLENDLYAELAQQLLSYLAYKGEMSKKLFDENLLAFYNRLCIGNKVDEVFVEGYSRFRKNTLKSLVEGCRIETTFKNESQISQIIAVKPFLCRLVNASSLHIGLNNTSVPFSGEFYFLGGCTSTNILQQVLSISRGDYEDSVTIKCISERSNTSLNPMSVFIFISRPCDFISRIVAELRILPPIDSYILFPVVEGIEARLENAFTSPGLHHNFHDIERCEVFNLENVSFERLGGESLTEISLSRYMINPYKQLTILRSASHSAQVAPGWGKYLLLYLRGMSDGFIIYDPDSNTLAMRSSLGIPHPLDKIFFIATGRLGRTMRMRLDDNHLYPDNYGAFYTIYTGILLATARTIIERLGQNLDAKNFVKINLIP